MSDVRPVAAYIREGVADWRIELRPWKGCREALGPEVFNAFCRCFVHADRLSSLITFAYLSRMQYSPSTRGFARNLQSLVWFTVGALHELTLAVRDLRSAMAEGGVFDPESEPWRVLRDLESKLESDSFFRRMRNIAASHVDREIVEEGLTEMEGADDAILCERVGGTLRHSSKRLGVEVFFKGCGMSVTEFEGFMKGVSDDCDISSTIQEAFLLALEAAEIPLEDTDASVA